MIYDTYIYTFVISVSGNIKQKALKYHDDLLLFY